MNDNLGLKQALAEARGKFTHYAECDRCRLPGIYMKAHPIAGQAVKAHEVFFADGTSPMPNTTARCQYCKARLIFRMSRIREVPK